MARPDLYGIFLPAVDESMYDDATLLGLLQLVNRILSWRTIGEATIDLEMHLQLSTSS